MLFFFFLSLSSIFHTHITLISTAHLRIQGRIEQLKIAVDEIDEDMLKEENEGEEKLLKSIASNQEGFTVDNPPFLSLFFS